MPTKLQKIIKAAPAAYARLKRKALESSLNSLKRGCVLQD
jgi:hypothetical protein